MLGEPQPHGAHVGRSLTLTSGAAVVEGASNCERGGRESGSRQSIQGVGSELSYAWAPVGGPWGAQRPVGRVDTCIFTRTNLREYETCPSLNMQHSE